MTSLIPKRPHLLDSALLRPGRIDRFEYVPLPDADARRAIIEKVFPIKVPENLVESMNGYSGAEIVAIKTEAAYFALERSILESSEPELIDADIHERDCKFY